MKELYTSPEVKLINFVAEENLAANELDMSGSVAHLDTNDIAIELEWF